MIMKIGFAFVLWIIAVIFAVANGYLGETFVSSLISDYGVHLYKSISLIVFIFILAWIFARQTRGNGWFGSAIVAGILWFIQTISFEFLFGHYFLSVPWHDLISDYRIWKGRLGLFLPT